MVLDLKKKKKNASFAFLPLTLHFPEKGINVIVNLKLTYNLGEPRVIFSVVAWELHESKQFAFVYTAIPRLHLDLYKS